MGISRSLQASLLLLPLGPLLFGCGEGGPTQPQVVATVEVTPVVDTLTAIRDTQQFSAVAKDALGSTVEDVRFLWVSSNESVAIVDTAGLATARGPGETVITAAARGVPGHATLTVAVEMFTAVSAGDRHSCGVTTDGSEPGTEAARYAGPFVAQGRVRVALFVAGRRIVEADTDAPKFRIAGSTAPVQSR